MTPEEKFASAETANDRVYTLFRALTKEVDRLGDEREDNIADLAMLNLVLSWLTVWEGSEFDDAVPFDADGIGRRVEIALHTRGGLGGDTEMGVIEFADRLGLAIVNVEDDEVGIVNGNDMIIWTGADFVAAHAELRRLVALVEQEA